MNVPQQGSKTDLVSLHADDYAFAILVPHDPKESAVVRPGVGSLRSMRPEVRDGVLSALHDVTEAILRSC